MIRRFQLGQCAFITTLTLGTKYNDKKLTVLQKPKEKLQNKPHSSFKKRPIYAYLLL